MFTPGSDLNPTTRCVRHFRHRIYLRRNRMPNENNVIVRIEWAKILWSLDRILIAKAFAEEIWRAILGKEMPAPPPELKKKQIGFEGYL